VTEQVPVIVVHAPLQPLNVEPLVSVAASTTTVPDVNAAEHVVPQLIPDGLLVTAPAPFPFLVTLSVSTPPTIAVPVRSNI
jgi:hypothetical protein